MTSSKPYQTMPQHDPEDRAALKAHIARYGVLVPIIKDKHGNTLEGHTREELWHELRTEGVKLPDLPVLYLADLSEAEKRQHVIALNCLRRHLRREQARELVAELLKLAPQTSDRQVAKQVKVSPSTVGDVRHALEDRGELSKLDSCKGADGKVRRKPAVFARDSREQARALKAMEGLPADVLPAKVMDVKRLERIVREHHREQAKAEAQEVYVSGDATVLLGDFRERLVSVGDGEAALLVTDPPYTEGTLDLYGDLGRFAARVLRPGGFLFAYCGVHFLPRVYAMLGDHLDYWWTLAALHSGPAPVMYQRRMSSAYKPVLVYRKPGGDHPPLFRDVLNVGRCEKDLHDWQQALAEAKRLVEVFSLPGDLVIDPFVGSGTVGVASAQLGRRFIGCEIDPAAAATAQNRLAECATAAIAVGV